MKLFHIMHPDGQGWPPKVEGRMLRRWMIDISIKIIVCRKEKMVTLLNLAIVTSMLRIILRYTCDRRVNSINCIIGSYMCVIRVENVLAS